MPFKHDTIVGNVWTFAFPTPALDVSRPVQTQVPNTLSRLVGVDGRYAGRLKRFPGFVEILSDAGINSKIIFPGGNTFGGASGFKFFEPFAIQFGPGNTSIVRGVIFLLSTGTKDIIQLWWSLDGGALNNATLVSFADNDQVTDLDVTTDNQLLYIVASVKNSSTGAVTDFELLGRYTGSGPGGWQQVPWTTEAPPVLAFTSSSTKTTATSATAPQEVGFLEWGEKYGFSYRFVYPEQGFVGPLSTPIPVTTATRNASGGPTDANKVHLVLPSIAPPTSYGAIFNRCIVQVFRTPIRNFGGDIAARGNLFLEAEWEVPNSNVGTPGSDTWTPVGGGTPSYGQGTSPFIILDTAVPTGLAVDDIIYIETPVRTNDAPLLTAPPTADLVKVIYRRRIVAIDTGAKKITLDRDLGDLLNNNYLDGNTLAYNVWFFREAGTSMNKGTFQTVSDIHLGWRPHPNHVTSDTPQGLDDEALTAQPKLEPEEFAVFSSGGNPTSRFIEAYENVFVRVTRPSDIGSGRDVLRWGNTKLPRKGLVPVLNRRFLSDLTDSVTGMLRADPVLVVFLNNGLLRIHRSGDRLAIDPIHNRFGTASYRSAVAVGTSLYMASPVGILLVDLIKGRIDALNATQHFFDEGGSDTGNWRDDLANIFAAYDSPTGALYFLNATKHEALVLWLNNGTFTHLIDVPFDWAITSGDLRTGGLRRALFLNTTSNRVYEVNANRAAVSNTTFSYFGESGLKYNSTTTSTVSNTLNDSTQTFTDNLIGHFVRVKQSDGTWKRARITGRNSATQLSIDADIAPSGLDYTIGAIPFQITTGPLLGDPDNPILDLFGMKKVTAMGAAFLSDATPTAGKDQAVYQLFERTHTLPTATTSSDAVATATKDISVANNAANFVSLQRNHSMLVPGLEVWSSNFDFDLLGLVIQGKIGGSFRDNRA